MGERYRQLAHYMQQAAGLTACRFLQTHTHPVLLWSQSLDWSKKVSPDRETSLMDVGGDQQFLFSPETRPQAAEALVIEIRKYSSGSRSTMIYVGRAPDNDIVFTHRTVSKLHAYFVRKKDACEIVDAGSTNGTRVNDHRLIAHQSLSLVNQDRIRVGPAIELLYLTPRGFYGLLQQLVQSGIF
jgi:hypothetical protein